MLGVINAKKIVWFSELFSVLKYIKTCKVHFSSHARTITAYSIFSDDIIQSQTLKIKTIYKDIDRTRKL